VRGPCNISCRPVSMWGLEVLTMIGVHRDGVEEMSGIDNPVGFREEVVGIDLEGHGGEAACMESDASSGLDKLEEVVNLERIAVTQQAFAEPGLAVGIPRVDSDGADAVVSENTDGPEDEEDIDLDPLAS
jgi:hypothetical protein